MNTNTDTPKTNDRWLMTSFARLPKGESLRIDRKAGIIHGAAIVTEGEARGHGVNLDSEFIDTIVAQGNNLKMGVKARFGHPTMSSTALGTFIGRTKSFTVERLNGGISVARGDIHLDETARKSPNGDLYEYVLDMAEKNPDMFGTSIVFTPGAMYRRDSKGVKQYPRNANGEKNKAHDEAGGKVFIECEELHAADVVDDPAANPTGLFTAETWAGQMAEFLDTHPHLLELLESNPKVLEHFMSRYNEYRGRMGRPILILSTAKPTGAAGEPKQTNTVKEREDTHMGAEAPATVIPPKVETLKQPGELSEGDKVKAQLKRFTDTFGVESGVHYFNEGKSFEEAQSLFIAKQKQDIADLNKKLEGAKFGAPAPVSTPAAEPSLATPAKKKLGNEPPLKQFIRISGQPGAEKK